MDEAVIEVLREIRDEARQTNARLDQTNARLDLTNTRLEELGDHLGRRIDATNARLDQTNARLGRVETRLDETNAHLDRLEKRQVTAEMRLATEIISVAGAIDELKERFVVDRAVRRDLEDHERRIRSLEERRGGSER